MAAAPLITAADVRAHISAPRLLLALDDSNTGVVDEAALALLIDDATTYCRGKIGPVFEMATLNATTAGDLRRIALDVVRAYLAERHPEVFRYDSEKIFKRCDKHLEQIRMGMASLGTEAPPEPAANHGGEVTSGDPENPEPQEHFALSGTGSF